MSGSSAAAEAARVVRVLGARLVCRWCTRESEVSLSAGDRVPSPAHDARGYAIDGVEITFTGQCPGCREQGGS